MNGVNETTDMIQVVKDVDKAQLREKLAREQAHSEQLESRRSLLAMRLRESRVACARAELKLQLALFVALVEMGVIALLLGMHL